MLLLKVCNYHTHTRTHSKYRLVSLLKTAFYVLKTTKSYNYFPFNLAFSASQLAKKNLKMNHWLVINFLNSESELLLNIFWLLPIILNAIGVKAECNLLARLKAIKIK